MVARSQGVKCQTKVGAIKAAGRQTLPPNRRVELGSKPSLMLAPAKKCNVGNNLALNQGIHQQRSKQTHKIMKRKMPSGPFLSVHTDASDFALGGVLMQECYPVAYESRKLNEAERRYTIHEKELLTVVHCLRVWRHYLLGFSFIVWTDNIAVSHFLSQSKLTSKQTRWQELLAEFNFMLEYRAGSTNSVADTLSRRAELDQVALMTMNAIVRADNRVAINIEKKIRKALTRDPVPNNC
ncbi:hypothetical protein RJ639_017450 [Escallonia herrerae]|uniref:Reverse transcriptase RNase H-like domain-containing protein n=1 Tax=Escallonia herrerae TaxID=1293975 RepID=A0AA89AJI9_9ASTE|nr:hypothetical protein RJ639_017450 [Escallonia herrerae]